MLDRERSILTALFHKLLVHYGLREPRLYRKARIAIVGAGMGGAVAASFIRRRFGAENETVEIWVIEASERTGGRCKLCQVDGEEYEAGAAIYSELNVLFQRSMEQLGLVRSQRLKVDLPFTIVGKEGPGSPAFRSYASESSWMRLLPFWLRLLVVHVITTVQLVRKYGFWDLRRLKRLVKHGAARLDFGPLYRDLDGGWGFATAEEVYERVGDPERVARLVGSSAMDSVFGGGAAAAAGFESLQVVDDLVNPNMRCNYGGQDLHSLHGLVGMVSLAGGVGSECYPVLGGNEQVPRGLLERAIPGGGRGTAGGEVGDRLLLRTRVQSIARGADGKKFDLTLNSAGDAVGEERRWVERGFDCVLLCSPLEDGALRDALPEDLRAPYFGALPTDMEKRARRRCVATFVQGDLDQAYVTTAMSAANGGDGDAGVAAAAAARQSTASWTSAGRVPVLQVLTKPGAPLPFYSLAVQVPVRVGGKREAASHLHAALRDGRAVYKIFSAAPLSDAELDGIFVDWRRETKVVEDWFAYPDYAALRNVMKVWNPTSLLPFVLCDGVEGGIFYANAVEQLAGAMEMAAIGGNVVANLAVQWCLRVVGQTRRTKGEAAHAKAD